LRLGARFPGVTPPLNRAVSRLYFRAGRRVGVSHRMLNVAMPPVHREMEYGVALADAPAALRELAQAVQKHAWRINFVAEIRFARADDAWLSPAYHRESCHIGAYMGQSPDLAPYFEAFERIMLEHGGRPHWGKEHNLSRAEVRARLPLYDRFAALRRELDPAGVFRNAWVSRMFED
jgi:L-gulonolactone oxidase